MFLCVCVCVKIYDQTQFEPIHLTPEINSIIKENPHRIAANAHYFWRWTCSSTTHSFISIYLKFAREPQNNTAMKNLFPTGYFFPFWVHSVVNKNFLISCCVSGIYSHKTGNIYSPATSNVSLHTWQLECQPLHLYFQRSMTLLGERQTVLKEKYEERKKKHRIRK